MSLPRAPFWMYLIAISFVVYFAVFFCAWAWGPEDLGIQREFGGGRLTVKAIFPGSPAERAGLQPGDHVKAFGSFRTENLFDWAVAVGELEVNHPYKLQIERAGQEQELTLTLGPNSLRRWTWNDWLVLIGRLVALGIGFVIAFSRPHDTAARLGGLLLASQAIIRVLPPNGMNVVWGSLPVLLGAILWIPTVGIVTIPVALFSFAATFPRVLFRKRWVWVLIWVPLAFALLVLMPWTLAMVYTPKEIPSLPTTYIPPIAVLAALYILGALVAFVLNYRRLDDLNERRRIRVLVGGSLIAWVAVLPDFLLVYLGGKYAPAFLISVAANISLLGFLLFPLSFAYAILRHRLFDIRVIIRQGLQYAFARRVLLTLVPLLTGIFLVDVLLHGDQPLLVILRQRGWVYVALAGIALAAHFKRRDWLAALDHRFFRERYDANQILREIVEDVRRARSFKDVAPRVVARIVAALHPEFAALMTRSPQETNFSALATAPSGQSPPSLPVESKVIALVRLLDKALELPLTDSGWLQQQLPREEMQLLRAAGVELIVPVAIKSEAAEALLVLGTKRSEEPYSLEDRDLLSAIAASLAWLIEQPVATPVPASSVFGECPKCGDCYDSGVSQCARDSASLATTALPRVLEGRYRLERRLGRGGMGTVYVATDSALERRVAVKVISDNLVGSAEAAERFRREARASAGFSHPNVVTVHDYGVAAGTRAFLVMELLSGASLREQLRREKRVAPERAMQILRGVLAAVEAAHRRQLVHRDLKPENIFLSRSDAGEVVKVLDFGLAKFLPSDTQVTQDVDTGAGIVVGTWGYMSPEQLRGEAVSTSWDLWALSVCAYEMLTGAQPFPPQAHAVWLAAVSAGQFTPVAVHLPDAPARWQEMFSRLLASERERRPGTAAALLAEFEDALEFAAQRR